MPIELTPAGGSLQPVLGAATQGGSRPPPGGTNPVPVTFPLPVQIVGFVPMTDCSFEECRCLPEPCCYCNPVFGVAPKGGTIGTNVIAGARTASIYENDTSSFLFEIPQLFTRSPYSVVFRLEKCVKNEFVKKTDLTDNTFGLLYKVGTIAGHPRYVGFEINWGFVIGDGYSGYGEGTYRICLIMLKAVEGKPSEQLGCLCSEPFCLKNWDCQRADGTVRFENFLKGKIGDINADGKVFDLRGINWHDSIRFKGFFGYETTPEYLEVLHEHQNGSIKRIRDEAIQKFKLKTNLLPKWFLDRFKSYGLMADVLLVSDYNINNSDYNIKQKQVIRASGFEPTYFDKQRRRIGRVEVDFKEGIENVIKSICC